jgi:hypothetical protein
MNIDDSWLIARFQRLITEILIEKRLGQRRPGACRLVWCIHQLGDEAMQAKTHKRSRGSKSGSPFHKKPKWHSWNGFKYDMHGNGMGVFYWIGDCRISSG